MPTPIDFPLTPEGIADWIKAAASTQASSLPDEEDDRRPAVRHTPEKLKVSDPVVPRSDWGALPSRRPLKQRKAPVTAVLVTDTTTESCSSEPSCQQRVVDIQRSFIQDKAEDDMPYSFLIGGDGRVYEGRGWTAAVKPPEMLPEQYEDDPNMLHVAFIGDYDVDEPTDYIRDDMVVARKQLTDYGLQENLIPKTAEMVTCLPFRI